jgi:CRP-like cAMP-binding protein
MRSVGVTILDCKAEAVGECWVLVLNTAAAHAQRRKTAPRWSALQGPMLFDCLKDRDRIKFATTRSRVAALLLEMADTEGNIPGVTQRDLADWLGLQRESVSVALREFRREGIIRWARGKVTLLELAALERAASGLPPR